MIVEKTCPRQSLTKLVLHYYEYLEQSDSTHNIGSIVPVSGGKA